MGFRFRRSFGPKGFKVNISKNGLSSLSIGKAPFTVNIPLGRKGGTRVTGSIPGTGLSWSEQTPMSERNKSSGNQHLTTQLPETFYKKRVKSDEAVWKALAEAEAQGAVITNRKKEKIRLFLQLRGEMEESLEIAETTEDASERAVHLAIAQSRLQQIDELEKKHDLPTKLRADEAWAKVRRLNRLY